tara:strand:- start:1507 stop:1704 length:198 start_codon:yes stop_codon:yes gene_type:complete
MADAHLCLYSLIEAVSALASPVEGLALWSQIQSGTAPPSPVTVGTELDGLIEDDAEPPSPVSQCA